MMSVFMPGPLSHYGCTCPVQIVKMRAPEKKVWLGGVGPAWSGGFNNLSDTFAAGFL